MPCLHE